MVWIANTHGVHRQETGFTMLEVMTVMLMAFIVLGASIPVLDNIYASVKLRTAAESLVIGIQLAKLKAINENATVTLTINESAKSFQVGNEGTQFFHNSVSFSTTPPSTLTFDSLGRLTSGTTTTLSLVGSNGSASTISINPSGRVSIS